MSRWNLGSMLRINGLFHLITYKSGQISIIPKPELRGFWGSSLIKPPFRVTSADVVIICPNKCDIPWGEITNPFRSNHHLIPSHFPGTNRPALKQCRTEPKFESAHSWSRFGTTRDRAHRGKISHLMGMGYI